MIEQIKLLITNKNWWQRKDVESVECFNHLIEYTKFLDHPTMSQRAWHVINNIFEYPKCEYCGTDVKQFYATGYSRFCSKKCSANSLESKTKQQQTNLDRYGVKFLIHNDELRKKMEATNIERYSGRSSLSSTIVQDKIKKTIRRKYGASSHLQNEDVKQKIKNTMLNTYGAEHALQDSATLDKMHDTMQSKYGVKHALQLNIFLEKARATNNELYDRDSYMQRNIPADVLKLIDDREWLIQKHHVEKLPLTTISESLGIDPTTIANRMKKFDIEVKHYFSSSGERELREFIEELGFTVIRNSQKLIYPSELDIIIESKKIAIEYCGLFWHSDYIKDGDYHKNKYDICNNIGYRLITIFENEWLDNKQIVKDKLINILGKSEKQRIYARKCEIVDVNRNDKSTFFDINHVQGDGPSSINIGLKHENTVVAVIGFIKTKTHYVLNRYATSVSVIGGFSKLLSYFEQKYNHPTIITFADLRWSDGDLYYNNGFTLDKTLKPDYYWTNGRKLWHKFNFRHSTMKNKLSNYDPELSESQNMYNNGYYKIYDCGKLRFIKNQ